MVAWGRLGRRNCQGVQDGHVHTQQYLKWITNKDLLISTWSSAQSYVAAWMGGELGREWIRVYVWLSPFTVYPKLSQHCLLAVSRFSSVAQSCLTLCNSTDCSTPGFPVHHQLLEPIQTHVHHIGDATQPSHPLLSPSPPTFNLSQHQGLFQ